MPRSKNSLPTIMHHRCLRSCARKKLSSKSSIIQCNPYCRSTKFISISTCFRNLSNWFINNSTWSVSFINSSVVHGIVDHPVSTCFPTAFQGLIKLHIKMFVSFSIRHVWNKRVLKILDIFDTRDFWNAGVHHHHEKRDEEPAVLAQNLECPTAEHSKPKEQGH